MAGLADWLSGAWKGITGDVVEGTSKGLQSGWDFGSSVADTFSNVGSYITPKALDYGVKGLAAYSQYNTGQAYKDKLKQDAARSDRMAALAEQSQAWNLEEAKRRAADEKKEEETMSSAFAKYYT
jgi:hypothetical protein